MDIFDTFFLVEYLRQWAARGRIVILTIHPPTYEIFTMISKVINTKERERQFGMVLMFFLQLNVFFWPNTTNKWIELKFCGKMGDEMPCENF